MKGKRKAKREGYWPLLTTKQVAAAFGVTVASVSNWVRGGLLKPLIREPSFFVYEGGEVERFRREVWPFLHTGPGQKKGRGTR